MVQVPILKFSSCHLPQENDPSYEMPAKYQFVPPFLVRIYLLHSWRDCVGCCSSILQTLSSPCRCFEGTIDRYPEEPWNDWVLPVRPCRLALHKARRNCALHRQTQCRPLLHPQSFSMMRDQ